MAVQLTTDEKVTLTLRGETATGATAPLDVNEAPIWTISDPAVAELQINGFSAVLVALAPGTALVEATADADLGPGQRFLQATLDVTVVAAEATQLVIDAGAPEPK